jgi:hypothetical protein
MTPSRDKARACSFFNRLGLTDMANHARQHVHGFTQMRQTARALSCFLLFCWSPGQSHLSASPDEGLLDKRPGAPAPGEPPAELRQFSNKTRCWTRSGAEPVQAHPAVLLNNLPPSCDLDTDCKSWVVLIFPGFLAACVSSYGEPGPRNTLI